MSGFSSAGFQEENSNETFYIVGAPGALNYRGNFFLILRMQEVNEYIVPLLKFF